MKLGFVFRRGNSAFKWERYPVIRREARVTKDNARPNGDLLAWFPYLGPPHNA